MFHQLVLLRICPALSSYKVKSVYTLNKGPIQLNSCFLILIFSLPYLYDTKYMSKYVPPHIRATGFDMWLMKVVVM